ncbi:MAG: SDR family oxidoreductase [Sphingobacteriales bacterium]|nr:MAG: SDR family oxidoreductase [Sphingobacteriales bacterium]
MQSLNSRFLEKNVVITGGARGIGFEIAKQFGLEGAIVSILDFNADSLKEANQKLIDLGIKTFGYFIDISNRVEVFDLIANIDAQIPIDVLINNAGIAFETPFLNIEEKEWKAIIDINLTGMFNVGQAVCKLMAERKSGVVVNMASKNGLDGEAGYAHYNSSKGGVIMLTKSMAIEMAPYGVRVNAVCPGYIQTPMSMEIDSPEFTQKFVDRYIPLNRPGKVEEIAPIFLFLASQESSFITGQTIVADGGQLAGQKP